MKNIIDVEIKLLHDNFRNDVWELPNYATDGSAAFDLLAAIDEELIIPPFRTEMVPTGLSIWIKNPNYVLLIAPRSGAGCKKNIMLGNTIGVIDSDYQGPLLMCISNKTSNEIKIAPGEHICQALIVEKYHINYKIVNEFSDFTIRGENGFGHSKV
jgi:dUTP pyrophosphatase